MLLLPGFQSRDDENGALGDGGPGGGCAAIAKSLSAPQVLY